MRFRRTKLAWYSGRRHASGFAQRLSPTAMIARQPEAPSGLTRAGAQAQPIFLSRTQLPRPVCVRADGENPITASAKLHVARLPRDGDSNHPTGWVQRRAWLGRRRTPPRYPPLAPMAIRRRCRTYRWPALPLPWPARSCWRTAPAQRSRRTLAVASERCWTVQRFASTGCVSLFSGSRAHSLV
jgi:hypothetical protein